MTRRERLDIQQHYAATREEDQNFARGVLLALASRPARLTGDPMTSNLVFAQAADINGTSLRGYYESPWPFTETVARLLAAAELTIDQAIGDEYKTSFEIVGTFNGHTFTLYDYKADMAIHIGGHDNLNVKGLVQALDARLQTVTPQPFVATLHYDDSEGESYAYEPQVAAPPPYATTHPAHDTNRAALDAIQQVMAAQTWDSRTLEAISDILNDAAFPVENRLRLHTPPTDV